MRFGSASRCARLRRELFGRLKKQKPLWPPGTGHGYHVRTFGFLLDELMRRISGKTLVRLLAGRFSRGRSNSIFGSDCPKKQNSRVATIYAAKSGKPPEPAKFYLDLATPGTLARKTFTSPYGLNVISKMNDPTIRAQPIVSFGGIGSASVACEILFHARQRRRIGWADFLFAKNDRMDDHDTY